DSSRVTERTLAGKIYVANFFFTTCPGICPQMTDNMGILQKEYLEDKDVMLISHSVTPNRDTVAKLKGYASKRNVQSIKWHLLTGDREQIYNLGRNAYFIEENMGIEKTIDDFLHTENFVLVDKQKHIRGIYNGLNKASIQQLIEDIKTLKSQG
ncbi:MAG: protein SCO1/2, partial [Psychromonas sp.]